MGKSLEKHISDIRQQRVFATSKLWQYMQSSPKCAHSGSAKPHSNFESKNIVNHSFFADLSEYL